jgi:hypothetical protein
MKFIDEQLKSVERNFCAYKEFLNDVESQGKLFLLPLNSHSTSMYVLCVLSLC